jgi:hypothetical protein
MVMVLIESIPQPAAAQPVLRFASRGMHDIGSTQLSQQAQMSIDRRQPGPFTAPTKLGEQLLSRAESSASANAASMACAWRVSRTRPAGRRSAEGSIQTSSRGRRSRVRGGLRPATLT